MITISFPFVSSPLPFSLSVCSSSFCIMLGTVAIDRLICSYVRLRAATREASSKNGRKLKGKEKAEDEDNGGGDIHTCPPAFKQVDTCTCVLCTPICKFTRRTIEEEDYGLRRGGGIKTEMSGFTKFRDSKSHALDTMPWINQDALSRQSAIYRSNTHLRKCYWMAAGKLVVESFYNHVHVCACFSRIMQFAVEQVELDAERNA